MKNIIILLITFLAIGVTSCKDDDVEDEMAGCLVFPNLPNGYFNIFDASGNSLIGETNEYQFEDLRLFDNTTEFELQFLIDEFEDIPPTVDFDYGTMESNKDYFLELNETETDTLNFIFEVINGDCSERLIISKAFSNGNELFVSNGNHFEIVK